MVHSEIVLLFFIRTLFAFGSILFGISLECYKFAHQVLVHIHYSSIIIKVAAVVLG